MNKRDFIVQGGSALLGSTALGSAWAAAKPSVHPDSLATDTSMQSSWQALLGESFTGQTTLGRTVSLALFDVASKPADTASNMAQFTVSFQGPRALPLKTGLHQLTHHQTGPVQLYLEAVHQGERIHYDAHFCLLS